MASHTMLALRSCRHNLDVVMMCWPGTTAFPDHHLPTCRFKLKACDTGTNLRMRLLIRRPPLHTSVLHDLLSEKGALIAAELLFPSRLYT